MKLMTKKEFTNELVSRFAKSLKRSVFEFEKGQEDCKMGIYDKWYRYNRDDEGFAYDCGWYSQNQKTQNESVIFVELPF